MKQVKICGNPDCRAENKVTNNFCSTCGKPLPKEETQKNTVHAEGAASPIKLTKTSAEAPKPASRLDKKPPTRAEKTVTPGNKKSSKKPLVIVGSIIALCVIAYAILFFTVGNKASVLKQLDEASETGKASDFLSVVSMDDYSAIEKKAFTKMVEEENSAQLATETINAFEKMEKDNALTSDMAFNSGQNKLTLVKTKKWGLFTNYAIEPTAVAVTAPTAQENLKIKFDGKEEELGMGADTWERKLLPGEYDYTIIWDSPYGQVEKVFTGAVYNDYTNEWPTEMELFSPVSIPSTYEDKDLTFYVNGDKADVLIEDNQLVVPRNSAFDLQAKFEEDGKEYTSKTIKVNSTTSTELVFEDYGKKEQAATPQQPEEDTTADDNTADVEAEMNELLSAYFVYYVNGDANSLSEVIAPGTEFLSSQTNYVRGLQEKGTQVDLRNYQIASINKLSSTEFIATVNEDYVVQKAGEAAKNIHQVSEYTVKNINGRYYMTKLTIR